MDKDTYILFDSDGDETDESEILFRGTVEEFKEWIAKEFLRDGEVFGFTFKKET